MVQLRTLDFRDANVEMWHEVPSGPNSTAYGGALHSQRSFTLTRSSLTAPGTLSGRVSNNVKHAIAINTVTVYKHVTLNIIKIGQNINQHQFTMIGSNCIIMVHRHVHRIL